MTSLIIFFGIIVFFALTLIVSNSYQKKRGITETHETQPPLIDTGGCCGKHDVCDKFKIISSFKHDEPEYFNDEELDQYKGVESNAYTDAQADEFREVFYTMIDEEKPRWVHSLKLRGINLPNQLKAEVLSVVNEIRSCSVSSPALS
ncbi:MAG: hypothetical protein WCR12_01420 [Dysgonamonadaceae bacterium]